MIGFIKHVVIIILGACCVIGSVILVKVGFIAVTGYGCASVEVLGHPVYLGDDCKSPKGEGQ